MKMQCYCIVFLGMAVPSFSQEKGPSVIASAGDISKAGNIVLEWTVGEPFVESISNSSVLYTQGFHQPILRIQKVNTIAGSGDLINVYPNPTSGIVNIKLSKRAESTLQLNLFDMNGKAILSNTLPVGAILQTINISRFSHGAYLLRITDKKGNFQSSYKIIKAQ